MRRYLMQRMFLIVFVFMTSTGTVLADEIRVLSAGPLEDGLIVIAEAYKAQTGHDVTLETGTTPVVREHLEAGELFDVVIGTRAVVDQAAERGQVDASTAPVVGRVGIGIAVRGGTEVPPVRNSDGLKAFLLSADTVSYNQGSSGVYSQSMIESLGITDDIAAATTQYANGTQVIAHVREGDGRDLGLAPLTEIQANAALGVRMIPLPDEVQNYTAYHAVVGTGAVEPAADFVQFLLNTASREAFVATGVE
jgi:molybdate transport system substrate-binding protein